MKSTLLSALFSLPILLCSQDTLSTAEFDFWVGQWEVTWDEGEGRIGKGTNLIEKTLGGPVIQENFRITEGQSNGFQGTSISVYNPTTKIWKQAWADNQGGYFDFTGAKDETGNPVFITAPRTNGDQILISRMVFKNITKDSFQGDWEGSQDGGKTWTLNWRINYKRSI